MTQNQPVPAADRTTIDHDRTVRAAGVVLWREGETGMEVAVVHRPRYDDWSLPKGKLDPGELPAHAAVRETKEETGFSCVLSRYLTSVRYTVPQQPGVRVPKVVDFFAARARDGRFHANDEVDELRWLPPSAARHLFSYAFDSDVLDAFQALPADPATILLVRHAKAGKRTEWSGDDTLRPLSKSGLAQRDALHSLLSLFGPARVYSAPRVRCEQTVAPVAEELGMEIGIEPLLSEEGYLTDPDAALRRLLAIAAGPGSAVVCSQGGVIPALVTRLARSAGWNLGDVPCRKGSVWTLTFQAAIPGDEGGNPGLRLAAADYLADPLP